MKRILNVAEKHDVAKMISNVLSRNNSERNMIVDSKYKFFKYEFNSNEIIHDARMIFTHVAGHLYTIDFPGEFNDWFRTPYEKLFDAPLERKPGKNFKGIVDALKRLARTCQYLVIWTDCDREGENIGFEIINTCKKENNSLRISRAKFSDLNEKSIISACRNLKEPNINMSWAVEARQELDLRIGCAFSRMQTNYLRNSVPKLHDLKLISYGPCQFPTLGFVVERYNEIKNFLPETFWKIIVKYLRNKIDVNFTWDRNHLFDELSCQVIYESCMDSKEATVIFMDKKPKSKYRPQPLYTVEFEKLATKYLKLTSKQAMTIAEKLYSQGFISYPRTETNMFSSATNLVELIQPQISHPKWGEFARKVLQSGPNPRNGNKTDNAHPPIHPVKYTNELKGDELKVYDLITRHFLATCSFDGKGQETKISIKIVTEIFKATGLIITDRGYLDVYPFDKWSAQELPEFKLGEKFIPTTLTMDTGETSPPSLLTEADLIALMEKYQIGTDATHAEHIETIKTREYVNMVNDRFLPTCLGMGLIEGYKSMGFDTDECDLGKPFLRAELESELVRIVEGNLTKQAVIDKFVNKYLNIFKSVLEKKELLKITVEKYLLESVQNENNNSSQTTKKKRKEISKSKKTETKISNPKTKKSHGNEVLCKCKKPAKYAAVKDGPNKGRYYHACSNPKETSCKFFVWEDTNKS